MRMLDRHTALQFVKSTLFAMLAFCLLFIMVDMIENLDDFIDENVPAQIIFLYYVYFLPRILGLMAPVALLLASLFVVGRMSTTNELTVITCSGVSLYRFMLPFLLLGLLASGIMLGFDGWVVPRVNAARLHLEREYLKKHAQSGARYNLHFQDRDGRIVALEYFDESTSGARQVSVQRFDEKNPTRLIERYDAESMRWDEAAGIWRLFHGTRRILAAENGDIQKRESVFAFDSLNLGRLVLTPTMILRMQQKPEEMELGELRDYIERQRIAGSDINRLRVDYHGKVAFPFASLIVVFFGVPFASVKRRSGLSVQFGVSIFLCFTYLVSQKLSQVFGYNGSIPSLLAAWLPNMLFFLAGCFIMLRIRK